MFGNLIPGISKQVRFFVNDLANQQADSNALYIIEAGANDFFGDPNNDPTVSVANLESSITLLYSKGARNFLVTNLFDLSQFPRMSGISFQSIINHNHQFLFWDDMHLTTAGHQILGKFALNTPNQLIPESSAIWGLISFGILSIALKRKNYL